MTKASQNTNIIASEPHHRRHLGQNGLFKVCACVCARSCVLLWSNVCVCGCLGASFECMFGRAADNIAANGYGTSGFVGGDSEHIGAGPLALFNWFCAATLAFTLHCCTDQLRG